VKNSSRYSAQSYRASPTRSDQFRDVGGITADKTTTVRAMSQMAETPPPRHVAPTGTQVAPSQTPGRGAKRRPSRTAPPRPRPRCLRSHCNFGDGRNRACRAAAAHGACVAQSSVACKRVDKRGDAGAGVVRHPAGAHLRVGFCAGVDRRASRSVQLLLRGRVRSWGVLSEFARDRDRPRDEVGGRDDLVDPSACRRGGDVDGVGLQRCARRRRPPSRSGRSRARPSGTARRRRVR
jgi:hypothetical protein